ncbi:MAG: hypothetical protein ABI165_02105 [Bryobacteraceae bacterium]
MILLACAAAACAAPQLRLTGAVVGPISVVSGSNGPAQSVDTANIGDGALSLAVASSVPWLVPSVGQPHSCSLRGNCVPVVIALQTSPLAQGTYTGFITVSAPGALDAPQTISVTVAVGGAIPSSVQLYVPPGGSGSFNFTTGNRLGTAVSNPSGVSLTLGLSGNGSYQFSYPYVLTATAAPGTPAGAYKGSFTVSGSSFAPDNKTVPVTVNVTSQPIATPSAASVLFRLAQGVAKQSTAVVLTNSGAGTLTVSAASATTASGGSSWLSAQVNSNIVTVTADPTGLANGAYQGQVSVTGNAANPVSVPVELDVIPAAPAFTYFNGVVDNITFRGGQNLAAGDIVALFGEQLTTGPIQGASILPLGTQMGGAAVLVNNVPAPIYYVSYNQIDFQIPVDAAIGAGTVQVTRDGQPGNLISIGIAPSAPRLFRLNIGDYGLIVNQDGSFPIPAKPGLNAHAAKTGDVLTVYALGLGATNPPVMSGAGAPATEPFARLASVPSVNFAPNLFDGGIVATPQFAGLTPNFVGLYQINVVIPDGTPSGANVPLFVTTPDGVSNPVNIAVQ